jgi:hypothetical protein
MKASTNEVSTRPTNLLSNQLADLTLNNFCTRLIIVKHVHGCVHEHHQRKGPQSKPNDAGVKSNQGALSSIRQRIPSSKLHYFGLISAIRKLHNKNTHPLWTNVVTVTSNRASKELQYQYNINDTNKGPPEDQNATTTTQRWPQSTELQYQYNNNDTKKGPPVDKNATTTTQRWPQ